MIIILIIDFDYYNGFQSLWSWLTVYQRELNSAIPSCCAGFKYRKSDQLKELEPIEFYIKQHFVEISKNHSNISALYAGNLNTIYFWYYQGYKAKNRVETNIPCIVIGVLTKGYILLGEFMFPNSIGSFVGKFFYFKLLIF